MIKSFKCADTELFFNGKRVAKFANFSTVAQRKLAMIEAAVELRDLRSPPGNHLEALEHDRIGQHSIRINKQWRICFIWTDSGAVDIEIVDYH